MQKIVLSLLLISLFTGSGPATAQETNPCLQSCELDKGQCRRSADERTQTDISFQFNPSNSFLDRRKDMLTLLDDNQRMTDAVKKLKFDRSEECNRSYVQCTMACKASNEVPKSITETSPTTQ